MMNSYITDDDKKFRNTVLSLSCKGLSRIKIRTIVNKVTEKKETI